MQFQGKWLLPQSLHMEPVTGVAMYVIHPMTNRVTGILRGAVSGNRRFHLLPFLEGRGTRMLSMLLLQVLPKESETQHINPNLLNNVLFKGLYVVSFVFSLNLCLSSFLFY